MTAFLIMVYKLSVLGVMGGVFLLVVRMAMDKVILDRINKVEAIRKARCLKRNKFGYIRLALFIAVPLINTYLFFALMYVLCLNDDIFRTYADVSLEATMKAYGITENDLI